MLIPRAAARYEFEVKRSRFIAEIEGCSSRSGAESVIARRREDHPDAAHVVYAFSLGDDKSRQFGMSDDGEPRGTAGRPALEVLKGSTVTDCVLTIIRYFGGTKLGTGGLVHAYGDAAKGCVAVLKTEEKRDLRRKTLTVPYENYQPVRTILEEARADIVSEQFTESVFVEIDVENGTELELQQRLHDVSRGTIHLQDEQQ